MLGRVPDHIQSTTPKAGGSLAAVGRLFQQQGPTKHHIHGRSTHRYPTCVRFHTSKAGGSLTAVEASPRTQWEQHRCYIADVFVPPDGGLALGLGFRASLVAPETRRLMRPWKSAGHPTVHLRMVFQREGTAGGTVSPRCTATSSCQRALRVLSIYSR